MVKSLRESAVKDILDFIDDINRLAGKPADSSKKKKKLPNKSLTKSSIAKASKDLIMSFPVLCDDSLNGKTAGMISKAVERKCVAMLQILFSAYVFKGDSGQDILRKWHNNLDDARFGLDDYLDLCDRFGESHIDTSTERRFITEGTKKIQAEMRSHVKTYPVSSFSEHSINDYRVSNKYGRTMVMEARPAPVDPEVRAAELDLTRAQAQQALSQAEKNAMDTESIRRRMSADIRNNNFDRAGKLAQLDKNRSDFFRNQLLDTDVKKANELTPSLMVVRFVDPETQVESQFIAGVKARLIPIDSFDIIQNVASKNRSRNGLLNFVKATTKEISFTKDFLLAIDKAKDDAKANTRRGKSNGIWKTLEKRSTTSVWKRLWSNANTAGAITTLVISQEVANLLKKEYDCNMADVRVASGIMDEYNLLAVCIVDESTEVARFLYDGEAYYEDLSFDSLERESGDGSYKKVINLLSKINK